MRVARIYVATALVAGQRHAVTASAANHIAKVLRLGVGAALTLFDGRGGEYAGRIAEMGKDRVWIEVGEHHALERESPLRLTLAQGISRGERMDWVVQKATELGVTCLVPVATERSVVHLDAHQAEKRVRHWRAVAVAACEQSGRNRLPEIAAPLGLQAFLDRSVGDVRLILSPHADRRLAEIAAPEPGVTLLIGPEGGFADGEYRAALSAGFEPVRLGPRILRTETAAIVALTVLQQRLGDL